MTAIPIRAAEPADIDALLRIEEAVFPGDRLTRRNFRHAVRSPSLLALVAGTPGDVRGYVFVETRRGSRAARLSSLAVAPDAGRAGLGRRLVLAAEQGARDRGCDLIRLEVRADNAGAIALYERAGYRRAGAEADYYDDGETALRFEKTLPADAVADTR
ncbi:GNAT family N-acetyltransferase [Enterovirga rhinocerotis]|uniref:GNAT family N-acetyltransferase n=1 Tax=Enterovirga rhinocerotis TaxID=1339210 RepID=UPI001FE15CFC|nr:N-acetyltransferase [Enterovirga rhinocerotis]